MELSPQVLEDILSITRAVKAERLTLSEGKTDLGRAHGLNPNSAAITIRSLKHMLNGERYRRALTVDATDYFLRRIREEDGNQGLELALASLLSHIDYRHSTGVNVPSLQTLLAKHKK